MTILDDRIAELDKSIIKVEKSIKIIGLMLFVSFVLFIVSAVAIMSKEDNDVSEKYYCQMVHEGVQPDYNGTYKQGKCPQPLEKQP